MTFCVGEMYLFIQKHNGGENVGKHNFKANYFSKVSSFGECTKMQLITSQNFNMQTCFSKFLWFSNLANFRMIKLTKTPIFPRVRTRDYTVLEDWNIICLTQIWITWLFPRIKNSITQGPTKLWLKIWREPLRLIQTLQLRSLYRWWRWRWPRSWGTRQRPRGRGWGRYRWRRTLNDVLFSSLHCQGGLDTLGENRPKLQILQPLTILLVLPYRNLCFVT